MVKPSVILAIFLCISFITYGQTYPGKISTDTSIKKDTFIHTITTNLNNSKIPTSGEKVYIARDKPYYGEGETILLSAFLVNLATHKPSNASRIIYVDLISPAGHSIRGLKIPVKNGTASGSIDIPSNAPTGYYRIRAYTNWMKNYDQEFFYDHPVKIYNYDEITGDTYIKYNRMMEFDMQFFPEGGHLVNRIPSRVAFKIRDESGKGIDVNGFIVDENAKWVTDLETRHKGMGDFSLLPEPGKKYFAYIAYKDYEKVFMLPSAKDEGVVMSINNLKEKYIHLLLKPSGHFAGSPVYVICQTRGIIYLSKKINVSGKGTLMQISKSTFPGGICQITVFSQDGIPLSERMVFIDDEDPVNTSIKSEDKTLRAREKINIEITLNDPFGLYIKDAVFSFTATDASKIARDPEDETILSYLLLSSDLKGPIEQPGYFLGRQSREKLVALDLLLLTHGWRRFNWEKVLDGSISETSYSHELTFSLSGMAIIEGKDTPLSRGHITLISKDEQYPGTWSTLTDEYGRFHIYGINIPDTLTLFSKSVNEKGKKVNIDLFFDNISPYPSKQKKFQEYPIPVNSGLKNYLENSREWNYIDSAYNFDESVLLENIEVKGEKYYDLKYGIPDATIEVDESMSKFRDIFQLMKGHLSGIIIAGNGLNTRVYIRGSSSFTIDRTPLFIIDGIPVNSVVPESALNATQLFSGEGSSDYEKLMQHSTLSSDRQSTNAILLSIHPSEVEKIEILKGLGASTGAFGTMGSNGAVIITTRLGAGIIDKRRSLGYEEINLPGFSVTKEFYSPDYEIPEYEHQKPDKRITLFWAPSIRTDENGKAFITFFNTDDTKSIQLIVEGITREGKPFYSMKTIGNNPNR